MTFILLFPEWSPAFEILIDWYFIAFVFVDVPTVFLSDHSMTKLDVRTVSVPSLEWNLDITRGQGIGKVYV